MTIRLAVVNDYEVVVRGVADMIRSSATDLEVVELDCGLPVEQPVDVALYDTFAMPTSLGPGVSDLASDARVGRVVVYSWSVDRQEVEALLRRGASGYVSKTLPAGDLVAALRAVHAGERVVADGAGPEENGSGVWPGKRNGLTPRESEVIAMITQGLSNAEIAERAALSINSVKSYIRTSYRKMGVTSRTNAVLWGLEHGFFRQPSRSTVRPQS